MKRIFALAAIACVSLCTKSSFGRTITGFHLAPAGAVTPLSTPAPNNDNTVNASPNTITLPAGGSVASPLVATTLGPIDYIFDVQASQGSTEYRVTTFIANNSGTAWTGFIFQLGTGSGASFSPIANAIPEIHPPTFDSPNFDPDLTNTAFNSVSLNAMQVTFAGAPLASGPSSVMTSSLSIDTLDDMISGGATNFTLRMIPVPEPAPVSLAVCAGLGLFALRKEKSKWNSSAG